MLLSFFVLTSQAQTTVHGPLSDRRQWLVTMDQVAGPVMQHLASNTLKSDMQMELSPTIDNPSHRTDVAYLEAFGRTLAGIAPWLQSEGGDAYEQGLRTQYRKWTLQALKNAVDPSAPDYLQWKGGQPLVDASFVALGLIRAPWLWEQLDEETKKRLHLELLSTRETVPVYSNWILFSAMIEAFFCRFDLPYDRVRIEYALRTFDSHWYTGDGMYADGMEYRQDYYNSYVIQPYLHAILETLKQKGRTYASIEKRFEQISGRYAQIQERMIAPDGSFPAIGRSLVYRGGAFQHLADMALREKLPKSISPAQVRGALTAVLVKTMSHPQTFTPEGWLNIGMVGHQPALAEFYITTGSLYLCSTVFLPLGLPADHAFWKDAPEPWTSVRLWNGDAVALDKGLDVK
jgi:hypothetical protein